MFQLSSSTICRPSRLEYGKFGVNSKYSYAYTGDSQGLLLQIIPTPFCCVLWGSGSLRVPQVHVKDVEICRGFRV